MKILITESQYRLIIEQETGYTRYLDRMYSNPEGAEKMNQAFKSIDPHTLLTIGAIGTAFIPVIGPFLSTALAATDAAFYYNEGDKKSAGITAAFAMLPFIGPVVSKIPGIKQLGSKGMAALASKIGKGKALTKAEIELTNAIKNFQPQIQQELSKTAPKLKKIIKDIEVYKPNFIKKYGEAEYNFELAGYLYDDAADASTKFVNKLKDVKAPTIKIKPILGGGADHRVFQSLVNPNVVFKAELRPGEVNKWYDTFRKFPNIFAKTIKKTKVKDTNGALLDAVVMEKLNTNKFTELWDVIEKSLHKIPKQERSTLEFFSKNIKSEPWKGKTFSQALEITKKDFPSLSKQVDEFRNIVNQLYKITPNPDIRRFNFGYDQSNVLKALDI